MDMNKKFKKYFSERPEHNFIINYNANDSPFLNPKRDRSYNNDFNSVIEELNQLNYILKSNLFCDSFTLKALYLNDKKNILTNNANKIISLLDFKSDLVKEISEVK